MENVVGELRRQALPVDVEPDGDFDGLCEYLEQWGKRRQAGFQNYSVAHQGLSAVRPCRAQVPFVAYPAGLMNIVALRLASQG